MCNPVCHICFFLVSYPVNFFMTSEIFLATILAGPNPQVCNQCRKNQQKKFLFVCLSAGQDKTARGSQVPHSASPLFPKSWSWLNANVFKNKATSKQLKYNRASRLAKNAGVILQFKFILISKLKELPHSEHGAFGDPESVGLQGSSP